MGKFRHIWRCMKINSVNRLINRFVSEYYLDSAETNVRWKLSSLVSLCVRRMAPLGEKRVKLVMLSLCIALSVCNSMNCSVVV